MTVVLDAWALVALLRGEVAAARVRELIAARRTIVSTINLGEVLYTVERAGGRERANDVVNQIRSIVEAEDPDWPLVRAAAQLKVRGGLSYADAFCLATAERHGATLATGDPELLDLADPPCAIENLRIH